MKNQPQTKPLFKIETGHSLESDGGKHSNTRKQLIATMSEMPVHPQKSIFISEKIIQSAGSASGVVKLCKDELRKTNKDIEFTVRTIKDAEGKYVGLRIWRIN